MYAVYVAIMPRIMMVKNSRDHANRVHHSWEAEDADADLVGEEDEGGFHFLSVRALKVLRLQCIVLTLVMPNFLPP
jgi:hypothetical protein